MTTGGADRPRMTCAKWSTTSLIPWPATAPGSRWAASTVLGSPGQPGDTGSYPAALNFSSHALHELACSQRPWTNTTGVPGFGMDAPSGSVWHSYPAPAPATRLAAGPVERARGARDDRKMESRTALVVRGGWDGHQPVE